LPVIGEYQYGLSGLTARRRARLESLFRRLEAESIVLCPNRETASWYATMRRQLKQKGRPIPEADLWIAALAGQHRLAIISDDPHFDDVVGIRRLGW
jgi:tRNA(fMet)-specific endonuclease VapC